MAELTSAWRTVRESICFITHAKKMSNSLNGVGKTFSIFGHYYSGSIALYVMTSLGIVLGKWCSKELDMHLQTGVTVVLLVIGEYSTVGGGRLNGSHGVCRDYCISI